jgi:hypothetical protein
VSNGAKKDSGIDTGTTTKPKTDSGTSTITGTCSKCATGTQCLCCSNSKKCMCTTECTSDDGCGGGSAAGTNQTRCNSRSNAKGMCAPDGYCSRL